MIRPKKLTPISDADIPAAPLSSQLEPKDTSFDEFAGAEAHDENADELTTYEILRARQLLSEINKRKNESLKLYEPIPVQREFHESLASEILLRGSNRAGKTLAAAVEFALAVTNQHSVSGKYPNGGVACIVGFDQAHLGKVIYDKLFKPGAFMVIRDEVTRKWRGFRPWEESDQKRKREARKAPPLIPARLLDGPPAWESRKEEVPKIIKLTTGWTIYFFSSKAAPPQGFQAQLYWFDEEIEHTGWYPEATMRLVDPTGLGNRGRFIWSATPLVGGDDLIDLHDRAESERGKSIRSVDEFFLTLADNPHTSQEDKAALAAKFINRPDEYRVRVLGEYAAAGFRVYPEFQRTFHGMGYEDLPGGKVPADWCRWIITDPGRTVCASLFIAVPPPSYGDFVLAYDELYIRQSTSIIYGEKMGQKTQGQFFEALLIDSHAGKVHEMSGGKTNEWQYSQALKAHGVWERVRAKSYYPGADDPESGVEAVHNWLHIRDCGTPKFRFLRDRLPNLEYEFKHFHYKRDGRNLTDKFALKNNHLMDCLRYIAMLDPKYRKPKAAAKPLTHVQRRMKEKREASCASGDHFISFGPASSVAIVTY